MNCDNFNAFDALINCCSCSGVSHPDDVASASTIFSQKLPGELFSAMSAFHTACANHCGDSSVNGVISPDIYPVARMVAIHVVTQLAVQFIHANAPSNAVASDVHDAVHDAYITQDISHITIDVPLSVHESDTMSDRLAVTSLVPSSNHSIFIHITAVHWSVHAH